MRSLRARLALAFALVAALVATLVGVAVYQLSSQDLLDRARAKVGGERADGGPRCTR